MSSSSALAVPATKRRLTEERDVAEASGSTAWLTGSLAEQCRRVARPASLRSITRVVVLQRCAALPPVGASTRQRAAGIVLAATVGLAIGALLGDLRVVG